MNELEKSVSQNDSNLSLKLEYIEKTSKGGKDENLPLINDLSQSVEALRRFSISSRPLTEFFQIES